MVNLGDGWSFDEANARIEAIKPEWVRSKPQ